jgi:hypothetical protein
MPRAVFAQLNLCNELKHKCDRAAQSRQTHHKVLISYEKWPPTGDLSKCFCDGLARFGLHLKRFGSPD